MYWEEYLRQKDFYQAVWKKMKSGYSGDMRRFLDRAYIVVSYRIGQITLDEDALSIARDCADFFVEDRYSSAYLKLVQELKRVERLADGKDKVDVLEKLLGFDISRLSVVEYRFEIRFTAVDIDFIQQLKQSKYCDKKLTDMSRVSIRVVLKGKKRWNYERERIS